GLLPVQLIDAARPGAHEVKGKRSGEKANGTHDPRSKRHNQGWRTQSLSNAEAMHGPGAAKGKYREAMGVLPSLQCMDASGIRHVFIYNLVNAPGRLFNRDT